QPLATSSSGHGRSRICPVVALTGHEADDLLAVAQAHPHALPVGRVGLLGLADEVLDDDALELGAAESGAQLGRRWLGPALPVHLVQAPNSRLLPCSATVTLPLASRNATLSHPVLRLATTGLRPPLIGAGYKEVPPSPLDWPHCRPTAARQVQKTLILPRK
uniref:Uncharacterized protein n=1 Tax=Apteryx owenii TaxID=8824 RepID=A0A8B9NS31_APTOW